MGSGELKPYQNECSYFKKIIPVAIRLAFKGEIKILIMAWY